MGCIVSIGKGGAMSIGDALILIGIGIWTLLCGFCGGVGFAYILGHRLDKEIWRRIQEWEAKISEAEETRRQMEHYR